MSTYQHVSTEFDRMGARATIERISRKSPLMLRPMSIDIAEDDSGELFDIKIAADVQLDVMDVQPRDRHLLLAASNWLGEDRFLCGHDEFHWFVAALPNRAKPVGVETAKESLKPDLVRRIEGRKHRGKRRRKSDVFLRQGEWFFIPWPHASIDRRRIERNGLLRRGAGSKPHTCSFLFRDGEREFECDRYPKLAFFESEYRNILRTRRKAKQWKWRALPW